MPVSEKFNKKSINDWLYAYLQSISYVDKNGVTFVYPKDVNLKSIWKIHPWVLNTQKKTRDFEPYIRINYRTLARQMAILEGTGFVVRGSVIGLDGKEIPNAYILPLPNDTPYKLIPLITIKYMLRTLQPNCIKVYLYLLNKYEWKKKDNKIYVFTAKELIESCLGMESTTNERDWFAMKCILDILSKCKLINIRRSVKSFSGHKYLVWELEKVNIEIEQEEVLKYFGESLEEI